MPEEQNLSGRGEGTATDPNGWFVRDLSGEWVFYTDESEARKVAEETGATIVAGTKDYPPPDADAYSEDDENEDDDDDGDDGDDGDDTKSS